MKIIKKIIFLGLRILKNLFSSLGYEISRKGKNDLFIKFYEQFKNSIELENNGMMSLVFSKDRAMQLHAFLCSYFENIENYSPMMVLYKASDNSHQKSYKELEIVFKDLPVIFISEISFRDQLIEMIEKTEKERFLFYVDDIIFTQKFDYSILKTINPYKTIVSLSRGKDMNYSMVIGKPLELPVFAARDNGLFEFDWNYFVNDRKEYLEEFTDWCWPLGVGGYMFARKEVLSILKVLSFKAPNSLEGSMQNFRRLFLNRKGICTENAIAVGVHANLVQTEGSNPIIGSFSIAELLEKWNQGYQINYREFYYKPMNITQKQHYTFILRENESKKNILL